MTDREGEDISIIAHGYGGRVLASREVALAVAEMLIKQAYEVPQDAVASASH